MYDFKFKPYNEMTDKDYEEIGFMSGLEIHQQILTEKKLFCRCPAGRYSNKYDAEILRHMRPTLSELGEYDGTALMEFKTKKEIIYRINRETVCTYEMDDTPPFELNDEALDIAVEIAMLYNCKLVDEIHIARKQYLDGSIPTGFQRTTIVGLDGEIPYKGRKINIVQLGLEEDACREVSDIGHRRIYLTDRLGMPLIESVTAPEMKYPVEVAEVGEILRRLVRSTGKVRTGTGAGREDVNVSVRGGTRVEIKGVPSLLRIPVLTYNEAMRQWNLLRLREELHRRGITPETFASRVTNVTKQLRKTTYQPIHNALELGKSANCVLLKGFKKLLRWQTQTDTYFGREISDRVRVIACLTTLPNIIHSDSTSETISAMEWQKIRKSAGASNDDTMVIVWGDERDIDMAAKEIASRAKEATIGIPSETRQALRDGTNGFERILPGPERMYPDTDLPPKKITKEKTDRLRLQLPEYYWKSEGWYKELKIPEDVINPLAISKYSLLFKKIVGELKINPVLASVVLIQFPKRLKKKKLDFNNLTIETIEEIFKAYKDGLMTKEGIYKEIEKAIINNGQFVKENIAPVIKEKELSQVISHCGKELKDFKYHDVKNKKKILTAFVMRKVIGRFDAEKAVKTVITSGKEKKQ